MILPAWSTAGDLSCSRIFMPNAVNFAESLDSKMQHLAWFFPLVALNWFFEIQQAKLEIPHLRRTGTACYDQKQGVRYFITDETVLA